MTTRTGVSVPHTEYFPQSKPPRLAWRWAGILADDRRQLTRFWPVVQNMVSQELRVRYQRSALGFVWTLLNPILMMTTMTLVFSQVFGIDNKLYAVNLFAGMVPWGFLANSVSDSAYCIIAQEGLIRKIYLPKLIFPLTKVLINLSTFVLSMAALFVLVVPLGAKVTFALLLLPVAVVLLAIFTLGLALLVSILNTFYRDFGHLVSVFLQAWYFATPIMYEITRLPESIRWRFWLNPAYSFVRLFQVILYDGRCPDLMTFLVAACVALVSLGVGYAAFKCHEDKLVFRL